MALKKELAGIKHIELIVISIIVLISISIFLFRTNQLLNIAEKESVQQTLSTIRLGVQFFVLKKIVEGKSYSLAKYQGTNPMKMLVNPPGNYVGEFQDEANNIVPKKAWYFDLNTNELVYRVSSETLLEEHDYSGELRYGLYYRKKDASEDYDGVFNLHLLQNKNLSQ